MKLYSRPRDRSLRAFKDWMQGIGYRLSPNTRDKMILQPWINNQQWIENWKKFWAKVDGASRSRKANNE